MYKPPESRPWRFWYGTKLWKTRRQAQLSAEPLCCMCLRPTPAAVVDHKKPHKGDYELFCDPANLQSLCKLHHDSTKKRMEARGTSLPGGDAAGMPSDPAHHWNM